MTIIDKNSSQYKKLKISYPRVVIISPANLNRPGGNVVSLMGIADAVNMAYGCKPYLINLSHSDAYQENVINDGVFTGVSKVKRVSRLVSIFLKSSFETLLFKGYCSKFDLLEKMLIENAEVLICCHLMSAASLEGLHIRAFTRICFTEVIESKIWNKLSRGNTLKSRIRRIVRPNAIKRDEDKASLFFNFRFCYSETEEVESNRAYLQVPFPYLCRSSKEVKKDIKNEPTLSDQTIGFIGNITWEPNRESLMDLLRLARVAKNLSVIVAGVGTDGLRGSSMIPSNVEILGEIQDPSCIYNKLNLLWCNVKTAGGVRVKVIEALCYGKIPICDEMSLEGIPPRFRCYTITPSQIPVPNEIITHKLDQINNNLDAICSHFSSGNLSKHIVNPIVSLVRSKKDSE
jgi:hypothetical protein